MRWKITFALVAFLAWVTIALAWTPPGNIDLRNYYSLYNATWVNSSKFNGTYYGVGSYLTGISTYNSTYDAYVTANVSAKTAYVDNATERSLFTETYNSTYAAYVAANISNSTTYLNNYQATYFYPVNKTMSNATAFGDNNKLYFGTDYDVAVYFNGTHLVIEKV